MATYTTASTYADNVDLNNLIWNSWQTSTTIPSLTFNQTWATWVNASYTSSTTVNTIETTSTNNIWSIWTDQSGNSRFIQIETYDTPENFLAEIWDKWANLNETQREESLKILRAKQTRQTELERERAAALERQRLEILATAEANQKAHELLLDVLDEEQKRTYEKDNVIYLTSEKRRKYRLTHQGNVSLLDDDGKEAIASFCIHADFRDKIPTEDQVAAKVLYLKYAEAEFERIANRTDLTQYQRPQVQNPALAA